MLRQGKSPRCTCILCRDKNTIFFFNLEKKKEYRMALHSGFFSFLERRETTVGGTVCLDLQSWMCKDVFPGLMYQRQRKNLKGNESSRIFF